MQAVVDKDATNDIATINLCLTDNITIIRIKVQRAMCTLSNWYSHNADNLYIKTADYNRIAKVQ